MYGTSLLKKSLLKPRFWPRLAHLLLARMCKCKTVYLRADGVVLEAGTGQGQGLWCALAGLDYEPELPIWLGQLRKGAVVIDVGANIGAYALRAARQVGPSGRVIALEPLPETAQRLRRNIVRNRIGNITVVEAAAGDKEGEVDLYAGDRQSSASMCHTGKGASHHVRMTTLDMLVMTQQLQRVDWIKMDIEGAEAIALRGAMDILAKFRPSILFENGSSGSQTIEVLRSAGYRIGRLDIDGSWSESVEGFNLFAVPQ